MKRVAFTISLIAFLTVNVFSQAIPKQISYQGVLKDASGNILTGDFSMTFKIYNDLSGGTALWSETQTVSVVNGLFNAQLGILNPITTVSFDRVHFLGITIGAESELAPRTLLRPTPYSFMAINVMDSSITTSKIMDGAVTKAKLGSDIISSGIGNDNLGNHTATQNIKLNNHWLSGDGGNEGIYVNNLGNVGIGTTEFTTYGQQAKFAVTGYSMLDSIRISGADVGGNQILIDKPSGFGIVNQGGPIIFRTGGDNTNSDRMVISKNGNVGIGTGNENSIDNLVYKLELGKTTDSYNNIRINSSQWGGLLFNDGSALAGNTYCGGISYGFESNALYLNTKSNDGIPRAKMIITRDGKVGIGTDEPEATVHIASEYDGLIVQNFDESNSYFVFKTINSGVTSFSITNAGNVGIGTATPTFKLSVKGDIGCTHLHETSDERLKKNIQTIINPLNKVLNLRGINFEWKDKEAYSEGTQIGFIAQDVINVLPEVVEKKGEYYSIQYAPITALLVEAIKEQQKIIEVLTCRIEKLEKK